MFCPVLLLFNNILRFFFLCEAVFLISILLRIFVNVDVRQVSGLLSALAPPFRPAVLAVMSARERAVLHDIVSVMLAYGLAYRQSLVDGSHDYVLHPPVNELALGGADAVNAANAALGVTPAVAYAIKQVNFMIWFHGITPTTPTVGYITLHNTQCTRTLRSS